jgi:hypothetical protein
MKDNFVNFNFKDTINYTNDSEVMTAVEAEDSFTKHGGTRLSNNFIDKDLVSIDNSTRHQNYFKRSDAYMRPYPKTADGKKRMRKEIIANMRKI